MVTRNIFLKVNSLTLTLKWGSPLMNCIVGFNVHCLSMVHIDFASLKDSLQKCQAYQLSLGKAKLGSLQHQHH